MLDEFLKNSTESKQASAGWGGDRFALYETNKPDETFVAQLTAWDTPQDAREFFDAYAKRTTKRYADANVTAQKDDRIEWQTSAGGVVMELRDSRVAILEGIPAKTNANTLLRMIW
jgi:hypothetical protein